VKQGGCSSGETVGATTEGRRSFQEESTWLNGGNKGEEGEDLQTFLITWKETCSFLF